MFAFKSRHPVAVPAVVVEYGWRGVMCFTEELTGKRVRFDRFDPVSPMHYVFFVSW